MFENKILFAGDPHGSFKNIISAVQEYSPDAIVLLGDFNLKAPIEHYLESILDKTKIYWIPGNHDFDSVAEYEYLFHSSLADYNLHLKVVEIAGVRIAGLGGILQAGYGNLENHLSGKIKNIGLIASPLI